jgi:hypothetical protein
MNAINSWIKRNPFWVIVICIALIIPLVGLVSVRTNSFNNPEDLFTRDLNEKNLLKPGEDGNYVASESFVTDEGLEFKTKANGAITVKGDSSYAKETDTFAVAKLTLKAGTYTLSSGLKNSNANSIYLTATYNGQTVNSYSGSTPGTFTLDVETEVTINLHVYPKAGWNTTVYPVLVPGDAAGSFWA